MQTTSSCAPSKPRVRTSVSEGILLSSTNGYMWDLFKEIITKVDAPTGDSLEEIKVIAERGVSFLRDEAI